MNLNCEFCNNSFSTKSNLNYHKKTNKKCLELQNKNDFIKCDFCDKLFTKQTIKVHNKTCKKKLKEEIKQTLNEKDDEINKLKKLLIEKDEEINNIQIEKDEKISNLRNEKDEEISNLRLRITELETQNKIYLQDRELVQKLALQPKNTTTNNNDNRINNNFFDDPERIKRMINEKLNEDYVCDGQKGVAQFAYDALLKDEDGNKNYICSDPSRQIFKFKNSEGNIEKDFKAVKLTNMLIDAGISSKSYEVAQTLWTKEDGGIDANKFEQYGPSHLEITELNMDNSVFRNKLAILTSL